LAPVPGQDTCVATQQPQAQLVYDYRRLQIAAAILARHERMGHAVQLVVNDANEPVCGPRVAVL
jgi:hypothetical protein